MIGNINIKYYTIVLALIAIFSVFVLSAHAQIGIDLAGANGGHIISGWDNRTCDASIEGAIRYNSSADIIEFCDSVGWQNF